MKKVRLLQIAVYLVFAALFFQDAAAGFYKGFREGYNAGMGHENKNNTETTVIPEASIDPSLISIVKNNEMLLNPDYKLEDIKMSADIRVNSKMLNTPFWLSFLNGFFVLALLLLLIRIAYVINKIIYHIYEGSIFESRPLKLIRQAGILMIAFSLVDYAYQQESLICYKSLVNSPVIILNNAAFSFEILMCGLLVLIVAEAFKQGAQLKEEQELTI
ncbi:DUF2975 domain-containing protein [Mucilaginibacter sp.]|uniref:DUF2975 domain-containing protein n=1 Tax=Mucilaginibacter sp. TaxID=1882438 RepID=UPI003D0E77C0